MTALGGSKTKAAVDYYYDVAGNIVRDLKKEISTLLTGHLMW